MKKGVNYPMLESVLMEDAIRGLFIDGKRLIPEADRPKKQVPLLEHYMVDDSVKGIIRHNLRWAAGKEERPEFKFAYLMLPTSCNQRCIGCFTGKDKGRLPAGLDGKFYSEQNVSEIIDFLKEHGAKAIVYGGGGELFTWTGSFDHIDQITNSGLSMVIFTNGTLLSEKDIERLSQKDISLIVSLRDTAEKDHNASVRMNGFRKSLATIDYAMRAGMHRQNRLAVEIPVTKNNEERVLYDFIPAMRSLGIIPFPEEYIHIMTSSDEKRLCHDFKEARKFFEKAAEIDRKLGYAHNNMFGQRTLAQPKCERPLYSFAIYPNGDIRDCPSHSIRYGNFHEVSLREVIYSENFKSALRDFQLCPCSVFYTHADSEIPERLPEHLEVFRCRR